MFPSSPWIGQVWTAPNGVSYQWTGFGWTKYAQPPAAALLGPSDINFNAMSRTTTAPPVSPLNGQRYLVPAGATGAWVGQTNKEATWNQSLLAWTFRTPVEGEVWWVADEDLLVGWSGTEYVSSAGYQWTRVGNDIYHLAPHVGFGTAAPLDAVHIKNSTRFVRFEKAGIDAFGIEPWSSGIAITNVTDNVPVMRVDGANKVGIGVSPSDAKLEVGGPVQVRTSPSLEVHPDGNDLFPTKASLVLQADTAEEHQREFLAVFSLSSRTGATEPTNSRDKVAVYGDIVGYAGTGNIWALNTVTQLEAGSGSYSAYGYELDFNNDAGHRGQADGAAGLAAPIAYGLGITGDSSFSSTAALLIHGVSANQWNRGICIAGGIASTGSSFQDFSSARRVIDIRGNPTWGIYIEQPAVKNYVAGPTGFGIDPGANQLAVAGNAVITGNVFLQGQTAIKDGFFQLDVISAGTQAIINFDTDDYVSYNRTGNLYSITVGGANQMVLGAGLVRFPQFGAGTLQTDATGVVSVSSDERAKHIMAAFERGLEAVRNLHPITYFWREGTGMDTRHLYAGFSAQDVQASIPEAVCEVGGRLSLADRPIIAALVNAVQELAAEVERLKGVHTVSVGTCQGK